MRGKLRIEVNGDSEDLKSFVKMLKEQKIPYSPKEESTPFREKRRSSGSDRVYDLIIPVLVAIAGVVITELTKETVKSIIKWLREREKEGKATRLKVTVEGNIIDLNLTQMKILGKIVNEASKEKKN